MENKKKNVVIRAVCLVLAAILIVAGVIVAIKCFGNKEGEPELITVTTVSDETSTTTETTLTTALESAATGSAAPTETSIVTELTGATELTAITGETKFTKPTGETELTSAVDNNVTDSTASASTTVSTVVEVDVCAAAPTSNSTNVKKSNEDIAKEVWQGKWGCGADRKAKLIAAGYNYSEIQKLVNEIAKGKSTPKKSTPVAAPKSRLTFVKTFTRGTYYAYGCAKKGGSGRQLISCSSGGQGVKGSIASWYLYKNYGYKRNGRTKVYLEISGYPSMNGWYYLDDSCAPGYNNVIDFFYINGRSCPFSRQGVVTVKCYI